jgi:hypothetical protein
MTAILLRECCEECPDDPCSECGCGGKTGCLKPSESSTDAYRIVSSGKNSNGDCEYILQPIDPETGEDLPDKMQDIIPEQQVDNNYVTIPCPEPPRDCGREGQCATLKYNSWSSGFVYNTEIIDDVCYYDLYASDGTVKGRYREEQLDFHGCCEYEYKWANPISGETADHLYVAYVSGWIDNEQTLTEHYYKWDAKNCAYYKFNDHDRERPFRYDPDDGGFKLTWLEDDGTTVVYERANEYPHKPPSYSTEVYKNDKTFWKHRASGGRMLLVSEMGGISQVKIQETPNPGMWGPYLGGGKITLDDFTGIVTYPITTPRSPMTDSEIFLVNITKACVAIGVPVHIKPYIPLHKWWNGGDFGSNNIIYGEYDALAVNITIYITQIQDHFAEDWAYHAAASITHEAIHLLQDYHLDPLGDTWLNIIGLPKTAEGLEEAKAGTFDWLHNPGRLNLEWEAHSNDGGLLNAGATPSDENLSNFSNILNLLRDRIEPDYYDY